MTLKRLPHSADRSSNGLETEGHLTVCWQRHRVFQFQPRNSTPSTPAGGNRNPQFPPELPVTAKWLNTAATLQKQSILSQTGKNYCFTDAISTVKEFPAPKFTPPSPFSTSVDPRKSDLNNRGSVSRHTAR
jgi:hypothetical protein